MATEQKMMMDFLARLPPGKNPYREVAHFLKGMTEPQPMPSWFHRMERGIAVAYLIVFLQAVYVIYIRLKTKRFYFFKFNTLGLLQLDRANHMAICEGMFSAASIAEQLCRDRAVIGHLHAGWATFFIGAKFMFAFVCIMLTFVIHVPGSVFQWLCVCNCALLEWKPMEAHPTREEYFMPRILAWILHVWLAVTILWTSVPLIWTACELFMECYYSNIIVKDVIHVLLRAASTYSPQKYKPTALFFKLLPLHAVIPHADLITHYAHMQVTFCLATSAIILVTYSPFLFLTFRSFNKRHTLNDNLRKQQWQVLTHALIQFKSFFISIPIMAYMISLPADTARYNPNYWIALRIVLALETSISGIVSMFLICCTTPKTVFNSEKPSMKFEITHMKGEMHEEVDESIIQEKSEAVLVSSHASIP
ncbi:hypothetical protein DFH28DRAFT_1106015 [Melampsora americana]|nr:hypothetical protein DFH28DRAFT_1106015 [Melampsora americana]